MTTRAPSSTSPCATARPMPLLPPVTSATLPSKRRRHAPAFAGVRELQQREVAVRPADQLHAHRQPGRAEADRHADARQARQGRVDHRLHPAVVGVHRAPGDRLRPAQLGIERPDLRRRQRQHVEALEQRQHAAVEGGALAAGLRPSACRSACWPWSYSHSASGLIRARLRRVGIGAARCARRRASAARPATRPRPARARSRAASARPAAERRDARQAALADLDDAGLHRQVAAEVAEPADAHAARSKASSRRGVGAPSSRSTAARAGRSRPARRAARRRRARCGPSALRC